MTGAIPSFSTRLHGLHRDNFIYDKRRTERDTYPHIRPAFRSLLEASIRHESAAICWHARQLFLAAASVIRVPLEAARSADYSAGRRL